MTETDRDPFFVVPWILCRCTIGQASWNHIFPYIASANCRMWVEKKNKIKNKKQKKWYPKGIWFKIVADKIVPKITGMSSMLGTRRWIRYPGYDSQVSNYEQEVFTLSFGGNMDKFVCPMLETSVKLVWTTSNRTRK